MYHNIGNIQKFVNLLKHPGWVLPADLIKDNAFGAVPLGGEAKNITRLQELIQANPLVPKAPDMSSVWGCFYVEQ